MHLFPGRWYLPREPHVFVPLANYFHPSCPSWWIAIWIILGCCHPDYKRAGWRHAVRACREFLDNEVFYLGTAEHERLSRMVFGNCEWPMEYYISYSHGAFAAMCRKLPMR